MKVSRKSWHAKVWAWWWAAKHDSNSNAALYTVKPNLCPYVRAILFWAPLSFLFNPSRSHFAKFFWGVLLATIEAGLIHFNGWKFVLLVELRLLIVVAIILSVAFGLFGIVTAINKVKKTDVMHSFAEVLEARYEAAHSKVCPTIELV